MFTPPKEQSSIITTRIINSDLERLQKIGSNKNLCIDTSSLIRAGIKILLKKIEDEKLTRFDIANILINL